MILLIIIEYMMDRNEQSSEENEVTRVAIAVIENRGRVLIGRREKEDALRGKWEFPGGKLRAGETARDGLCRELKEELDIEIEADEYMITLRHDYEHARVEITVFRVQGFQGAIQPRAYGKIKWVRPAELGTYDFPEANEPLIRILTSGH